MIQILLINRQQHFLDLARSVAHVAFFAASFRITDPGIETPRSEVLEGAFPERLAPWTPFVCSRRGNCKWVLGLEASSGTYYLTPLLALSRHSFVPILLGG